MEAIVMFVMGIWFGYFAVLPAFIGLCIAGIIAEHNDESGFAVIFLGLAAISAFFVFGITLEMVAMYSIAYLAIGFIWSFWRYKKFVATMVAEIKVRWSKDSSMQNASIESLKPKNNIDSIVYWILVWPFSAIENLAGDILTIVSNLVSTTFSGIYNKIYASAVGNLVE